MGTAKKQGALVTPGYLVWGASLAALVTTNIVAAYAIFYWSSVLNAWKTNTPIRAKHSRIRTPVLAPERVPWLCAPIRAAGSKHAAFGIRKRRCLSRRRVSTFSPKASTADAWPKAPLPWGAWAWHSLWREAARSLRWKCSLRKYRKRGQSKISFEVTHFGGRVFLNFDLTPFAHSLSDPSASMVTTNTAAAYAHRTRTTG
jgi:hypothetical protein